MSKNLRVLMPAVVTVVVALVASITFFGCEREPVVQQPTEPPAKQIAATAQTDGTQADAATVQTTCPIMEGNPINKNLFVEYKGKKVYFCCAGCPEKFLADPEKYVSKLPQFQN